MTGTGWFRTAAFGGVFAVIAILVTVRWGPLLSLDRTIAREQIGFGRDHADYVSTMRAVSDVFSPLVFHVLGSVAAVVAAACRRFRLAGWILLVTFGYLLGTGLKLAIRRHRPSSVLEHASGFSFPSGHAISVALAAIVVVVLCRRWMWVQAVAVLIVVATGWSRIALGVHYLSDVVAGMTLAGFWAALMWLLLRPISFGNGRSARGSAQLDGE